MIDNAIEGGTDATTRFETSWLIVRNDLGAGDGPPEVLTFGAGGGVEGDGTILPVFSFEEEALLFLRLCGFGGGWHASKSGIADLASVLSDVCSDVRRVALDPIPEIGPHGRTTSSACRGRSSSGCLLPDDDASHAPRAATCAGSPRRPWAGRNRSRTGDRNGPVFPKRAPHAPGGAAREKRQIGRKGPNYLNHNKLFTTGTANDGSSRPPDERTSSRSGTNPYADLKRIVKKNGLLDRQPAYFGGKIALSLCLLAVSLALLPILGSTWLQLANAVYLAVVFVQISFLAHDFGHRQFSFRSSWKNTWATLILGNLLLGISRQWWIDKHNEHHAHPNQMDVDPDVDIPLLAFEEEQAFEKRGLARFVVKYQAVLIFPLSLLQSLSMLRSSVKFLASKKARRPLTESFLIVVHFALYFGLLFFFLEPLQAMLFVAIHRGLFGLFMVSVFAPNHKAMPLLEQDSGTDFLRRQVLTSRNVVAHPITDFWYGGLNYQIEHHLFPRLPRNKLKEAQPIIKAFCRQLDISYHETSVLQSYREILQHLHKVGAPLRKGDEA